MKNDSWLEDERSVLSSASQRPKDPRFGRVYCRGQGARLWDIEGKDFIDLTCGYSASNFGHAFQPLVRVGTDQLHLLTHLTQEPHPGRFELASRLINACGYQPADCLVHFNATGSRAVETAWKAAYNFHPGKIVSISPSYHGRSLATAELSETHRAIPGIVSNQHIERRTANEFAYCAACSLGLKFPNCQTKCIEDLLRFLKENAANISAVIVEPAIGARGYIFPPDEYWLRLREITADLGILMIADEIQVGLGRCGSMLLSQKQGWKADLVILGKSLGGGIAPISAVIGRREIIECLPPDTESETFACTPFAARIAIEVLNQLEHGDWINLGSKLGAALRKWCQSAKDRRKLEVHVEGVGANAVLEFLTEKIWRSRIENSEVVGKAKQQAMQFARQCAENGLLVHHTGPHATRVVMLPPLNMTEEEFDETISRLERTVEQMSV